MDNIFIMHEDKVFLRLMAELAVMHLARDWKLSINKSWNIHRTCDGIDFCGQKIFADHALLRKRTKQADTKNLLNKIGMKKYGQIVKARKGEVPFEGMSMAQKKHPGDILCHNIEDYDKFLILIEDYKIDKSRVDFKMEQVEEVDDQGVIVTKKVPKDRLAIRFRFIDHVRKTGQLDEHGDEIEEPVWQPESWWLFTGSDILVDQARKEWELLDKGFYTVAAELTNKFGKKFYKFI